jgi:C-terminal processing protease CtpA/Prc
MNDYGVPGLIVDMRQNGGGNGFLADQMAAYFFDEVLEVGNTGYYDESLDDFYFDTRTVGYFYPPAPDLRYDGDVVVIVGPACASACEFFSYDMTIEDRAKIVGFYPTAGLGGSVEDFDMPDGITVRYAAWCLLWWCLSLRKPCSARATRSWTPLSPFWIPVNLMP